MTGKEFYEKIGGDYDKMFATLHSDEMIVKFAKMFLNDKSFDLLNEAMEKRDYEEAFKACHALKGVCLNMSYTKIGRLATEVTDDLRNGANIEGAVEKMPKLMEYYGELIEGINSL